jgi:hypothetical protein
MFKSLLDYLKSTQEEWQTPFRMPAAETEPELARDKQYKIGAQYLKLGRYEDAVKHLNNATTSKHYKKEAYYALAECYRQLKLIPLARRAYERLIRLDYNYKDVQAQIRQLDALENAVGVGNPRVLPQAASPAADTATVINTAPERYVMLATLYEGPLVRIYKVRDQLLGRVLALKHIAPEFPRRDAYLRQVQEHITLDHLNIVRIYDIDAQAGQIVMEYVDGWDLRTILRLKGPLAPDVFIYVAIQLINGLQQAHLKGIVHQALRPEHVLLTRQCALKITGFCASETPSDSPASGAAKPDMYRPPDILASQPLTVAANVYSFGIILYEMCTGRLPFTLNQIQGRERPPEVWPFDETPLPPGIAQILRYCLAYAPENREAMLRPVGEHLIHWYKQRQRRKSRSGDLAAYKDFLLMAWADGKITAAESAFLLHKRQELQVTEAEAQQAEVEVQQELQQLLKRQP